MIRSAETQRIIDMMKWGVLGDDKARKGLGTNVRQMEKWGGLVRDPAKRCLIPVTEFCEQTPTKYDLNDGKPPLCGQMWFGLQTGEPFAIAGFYQRLGEHDHFAMVTCDPNELVAPWHPKAMVTILRPEDYDRWLHGTYDDVVALQRAYPAELMTERGPEFPTRQPPAQTSLI